MNNLIFYKLYSLAHQSYFLDSIIIFCARYLIYIVIIFVFFFIIYKNSDELFDIRKPFNEIRIKFNKLVFVFSSVIVGYIASSILKDTFKHPRPFIVFADKVKPLFLHGGMDSFPSGHATFFGALILSTFYINKKLGIFCLVTGLLVGMARVAVGIHFPVDILAGYILGTLVALTLNYIFKFNNKLK